MSIKKIKKSINSYLDFIQTCDWREKEIYKFEFSNWLNSKVDIEIDKKNKILRECIKSQKLVYSFTNFEGVQFLRKSGRKKLSSFISVEDIRILQNGNNKKKLEEADCDLRTISFTALSAWLGTLSPLHFVPAPTTDFTEVYEFLFNLDKAPIKGFKAFSFYQLYSHLIRDEFMKIEDTEWVYLNFINSFRTSVKLDAKFEYDLSDINWIVEDFMLYVHRVELGLRDTSYLTPKFQKGDNSNSRSEITVNRLNRDSAIVKKLKNIYGSKCQICNLGIKQNSLSFVEGAHIKPLGGIHNGHDTISNLLCLCPNHHKLFDLGQFCIHSDYSIIGLKDYDSINVKHEVDLSNLKYHEKFVHKK